MRVASNCLLALALSATSGALMAADSVSILATSPTANEEGLVPGKVTFVRTGSSAPLTVRYRISGSAKSSLHGGYVSNVTLASAGSGYLRNYIAPISVPGGTVNATFSAQGIGGRITGFTMGQNGTNYDQSPPPAVTITDAYGSGAGGSAVIRGYVDSVSVTSGGAGYTSDPVVGFIGGGGSGTVATPTVIGNTVTGVTVNNRGSGYTSVPSVTFTGGGPTTPAAATAVLAYNVANITVVSGGTGYVSPTVTIAPPPSGVTATATATVTGSALDGVTALTAGYGYTVPTATTAQAGFSGTPAVLRPVSNGGVITGVAIESGGSGYVMPTVAITDSGGTGSGATARVTVKGGVIVGITLTNPGSGFTGSPVVAVTAGGGAGATFTGSVSGGQVVDLQVTAGGAAYTCPTIAISGVGAGAAAVATTDNGAIVAVEVTAGGAGYGTATVAVNDPSTLAEVQGTAQVLLAHPDFTAPAGASIDANGDLVGTITFNTGELTKDFAILPQRNGVGGGREVAVIVDPPLVTGTYTVDQQSTARVAIADADERASIVVNIPTAYPVPPAQTSPILPIEVQGRGEWQIDVAGSTRFRRQSFQVQADPDIGPIAAQGTDYWLTWSTYSIADSAGVFAVAVNLERNPPITKGAAKVGDTSVPVSWQPRIGSVICFEDPSDVTNGIYEVTGHVAGTDTNNPQITISPALKKISCIAGTTRLRVLGRKLDANGLDVYGTHQRTYFYAFPFMNSTPRARRSIALNFLQTDDYKVLTPTVGSVTLADNAVTTGLRFGANAGKPVSNGHVEVVLTAPFPTDVDVPFYVLGSSTAVLGTDFTIAGVNTTTRMGTVRVPAGSTIARIEIAPTTGAMSETRSVELALLQSPDYQLAPAGTSPVNPTASVTITPAPKTTAGEDVYLSITTRQNGAEPTTNGTFRITMTDASGTILVGTLAQNLGVTYTATGSAVAGVNFQTLSGNAIIPAGSKFVDVPLTVIDDGMVTADLSLVVSLASGAGYQVSAQSNTTVTILDAGPRIRVAATTATAARGGANGIFTVTNTRVVNRDTTVGYTVGGTAVVGTDYTALPGTVTIPSGQSTATIQVAALASATGATAATTVVVTLANDTAATTTYIVDSPNSDTVTIPAATPTGLVTSLGETISYSVTAVSDAQKPSTTGVFRFYLSNSAGTALNGTATAPLSITYAIGGTAVAGSAYTALSGTAIITTGAKSVDVSVAPIDNGTTGTTTVSVTIPAASWPSSVNTASLSIKDAGSTSAAAADPFRALPLAGGGGGSSGGCGLGSGLGLAMLGGGLAVAMALRRRRR